MPSVNPNSTRPRGRPRDMAARDAALNAAAGLISNDGIGAVTMEAVARISGVGKPTLYRNWRNREELAMAALLKDGAPKTSVRQTETATTDLLRHVTRVVAAFANSRGRNAALMVASADPDSELSKAFRNQVMLASREEGKTIVLRGIKEGSLRRNINVDAAVDMIYGPIFYRLLVGHGLVNDAFAQALVTEALRGIASSR
jgi:AcrR family transcriptional regulator